MTPADPQDPQHTGTSAWHEELMALLGELEAAHTPEAEASVLTHVTSLDPDLQAFLIERMTEQENPEAAAFLASLAAHPTTSGDVRTRARAGLATLAERGITPAVLGAEAFHTGWVQNGRERGEQILILGWRLPDDQLEALVFLLDWHGDGVKDFYRTRELSEAEWQELVEHNGQKGAPLVEISLAEGRALLEEALAEGKRFSRPVPREYRLAQSLIQRRIFDAAPLPAAPRQYVSPDLESVAVVEAYVRAMHFRDYLLAWELLAPGQPARGSEVRAEGVEAMRREHKHAARRRPDVSATREVEPGSDDAGQAVVLAEGEEESVEPGGRRVRRAVRERYTLQRTPDGWRIAQVERL
jgi:hypothetical protein